MQVSVVIQKLNGTGFRAKTVLPPLLSAVGPTREIVLSSLRDQLAEQFADEEFVSLEVPVPGETRHTRDAIVIGKADSNRWAEIAGAFQSDPDYAEVIEHMQAYRAQRNRELETLME